MGTLEQRLFPVTEEVRRQLVGPALCVGILGAVGAVAVALSPPLPDDIFFQLYMTHDLVASAAYAIGVFGAVWLVRWAAAGRIEIAVERLGAHLLWVALAVTVGLSVAAVTVYHNHPLALDEYSQFFQAKIFAAGRVWVDYPREIVSRLFHKDFMGPFFEAETGRAVSRYWPGFALMLAPFMKIGLPWLLNPLLAGGSLLLLAHIARRLLPGTTAPGWAVLLAVASPQFTVTAISYYSMSAHLFLNLLFVALLLEPSVRRLVLAGVVGSLALVLHQPLPHAAFAVPWIVWLVTARDDAGPPDRPGRLQRLLLVCLGYLPLSLVLGVGWNLLLRQILHAGASEAVTEASGQAALGFLRGAMINLGFSSLPTLDIVGFRAIEYLKLFLWTVPGLPILAALGWWRNRRTPGLRLLGWSAICSLLAFSLVPFSQGHGWGNRYFHQAWGTVPLLAAAMLVSAKRSREEWIRLMGVLACLSLVAGTALRFDQVHGFMRDHLNQLPPLAEGRRQVCFLVTDVGYYRADLVQNDPWFRDPVVILLSAGRLRDADLMHRLDPKAQRIYDNGLDTVWLMASGPESWDLGGPVIRGP